jgi:hypothetical protein
MKVVFATTCKGRTQHLSRTLPQNIEDNPDATFVVLDYNDDGEMATYLQAKHAQDIATGRLVVYQYREPVPFQMAHAKNMVHRCALLEGADVLVNMDADNFACPGFDQYLIEQFTGPQEISMWARMVKDGEGRLPRGISGRIAVSKTAFLLAGGYDEKYHTHSPDDKDFNYRLSLLGFEGREIDARYLQAILHTDKLRYREYPHAAQAAGEDFAVQPVSPIANAGNVGCGTVWRNFSPEPISIRPIPTRIFGIGMHKTATTSLHTALTMLGFKSGHWERAPWAKAIWREMRQFGNSPTLEKFYALCDLPIPLLFRELDRGYPGAKFILTVRDEWNWLTSVRKHWSLHHNKYRCQWDDDVFSHRVHNLLYGRTDFDPSTMLERYRRHNAEVLAYFSHRPSDLLVMDMEKGSKWKELCSFLNVPMPQDQYPVAGASCRESDMLISI